MVFSSNKWFAKKRQRINVWYHYLITLESISRIEIAKIQTIPKSAESRWRRVWQPCCELRENFAVFLYVFFYMLDVVSITVYDRDTLLNIGSSVAQRKPDFEFLNAGWLFTDTASEPFVWPARPSKHRRKRGKRAGVLVRLRRRAFQPLLPTILLANDESLDNKLCELRACISYQRETRDCCVICLT